MWAVMYFNGNNVKFKNEDDSIVDDETIKVHLAHEFAMLKQATVPVNMGWRTWWELHKEKYKYLYYIAQVLLSLVPTEAAGKKNIYLYIY